jgi:hypothetical protein
MQRKAYALVLGSALLGVAALAACGGGSGTSSAMPANITPGGSQLTTKGATFTFTINRTPVVKTQKLAKASRKPQYISSSAAGLQIAVTATGTPAVTQYVDISAASVLCTTSGNFETCTLTVPTIAATESLTVTEVDEAPTNEGTNGRPPGYGDGFSANTNILAIGSGVSTTTGGATSITLSLNPVLASVADNNDCFGQFFGTFTPSSTTNAAFDLVGTDLDRIVVTAGVPQTIFDYFGFRDAAFQKNYAGNTPQPFVDVNGSATPVTFLSNSQHVLLAVANSSTPPPIPTATKAAMADTTLMFDDFYVSLIIKLDGALTQPATVTVSNNLTALNPFTSQSYAASEVDTIVPISVSTPSSSISQGSMTTATVTASDFEGTGGLTPFAAVNSSGQGSGAGDCVDGSSIVRATVTETGAIDTTTWLQSFTITPATTPLVASPVTCTFVLGDVNTGNVNYLTPGYVVTPTVTVTVNP